VNDIRKIVLIRLGSIGDIILTTPLVRALRNSYPDAIIDFAVKECFADLVSTNPHITSVLAFDHKAGCGSLRELKWLIREKRYDLIVDLHKNFRSYYLRSNASAGHVSAYRKDILNRTLLVRFKINRFNNALPVYKRYFRALEHLDVQPDGRGTELPVPPEVMKKVSKILGTGGLSTGMTMIVLCPGAGFANKRWIPEGFAAAGDFFAKKYKCFVGLFGGEEDYDLCEKVQSLMHERSVNYAGKFTLLESAAGLRRSSLVITNDTGLMHMAQSQQKPVVAVFGPTVKELGYYPFPENSFVIEKNLPCRPCSHNGLNHCPKKHFRCMQDIDSGEVIKAAEQLFNSQILISDGRYGQNLVSSL